MGKACLVVFMKLLDFIIFGKICFVRDMNRLDMHGAHMHDILDNKLWC